MEVTFIGAALLPLAGGLFLTGSVLAMFSLLLLCSLMGGSAALILPALGGASIQPVQFVLPFMITRLILGHRRELGAITAAINANVALIAFVAYGAAVAIVGPRLFAGQMRVPPLRSRSSTYLFDTAPLVHSSQNITTTVYLVGTLIVAICAYATCTRANGARVLVRTGIAIAWIHVFLGVTDLLFGKTGYGMLLGAFRNATYAQLDQSYGNFIRIKGIFPEASAYAAFAFFWFIFLFECWFRRVLPRSTGPAAAALGLILLFSTSGTAYVGLAGYGAIFALRTLVAPQGMTAGRMLLLAGSLLLAFIIGCGAAVLVPTFAHSFSDMISHMTVAKGSSSSGLQRMFWARKGIEAFRVSMGIGVGPGSFRSSSLVTAILGSSGLVGILSFAAYVLRVFAPLRASTYGSGADEREQAGVAASWAMLIGLIPSAIIAPTCDPGLLFASFAGSALALRGIGRRQPAPAWRPHGTRPEAPPFAIDPRAAF